ncbi:hypothetical protein XENTR_v10004722 [Xenopus tropicalis]|nr:hypothetical protein XENTR_v10004722 [Xenopus tropicalis]
MIGRVWGVIFLCNLQFNVNFLFPGNSVRVVLNKCGDWGKKCSKVGNCTKAPPLSVSSVLNPKPPNTSFRSLKGTPDQSVCFVTLQNI